MSSLAERQRTMRGTFRASRGGFKPGGNLKAAGRDENTPKVRVEPNVLSAIMDIIKRLQESDGLFNGQQAHFDGINSSFSAPLTSDQLQARADKKAGERAKEMKKELQDVADVLYMIRSRVLEQVDVLDGHMNSCKLRGGFISLPDEILIIVLDYAADQYSFIVASVKAAVKLSHVCQRFRRLVIPRSDYWRWWSDDMEDTRMISTCISRCWDRKANLLMEMTLDERRSMSWERTEFLRLVCQNSEYWHSFTAGFHSSVNRELSDSELVELTVATKGIILPHLKKLDISYSAVMQPPDIIQKTLASVAHFYAGWSTPCLEAMSTENIIPIPFSGCQSLKSLTLNTFNAPREEGILDTSGILSFLSSCPVLEKISLRIDKADRAESPNPLAYNLPLEMAHVDKLVLDFTSCKINVLRSIFKNLHFPKADKLVLRIKTNSDYERSVDLNSPGVIRAVFANANVFPVLSSLILEVNDEARSYGRTVRFYRNNGLPSIPFSYVPKLRHLSLCPPMLDLHDETQVPAIRSLTLTGSCSLDYPLIPLLRLMDKQGVLRTLEWVRFEENHGLKIVNGEDVSDRSFTLRNEGLRKLIEKVG